MSRGISLPSTSNNWVLLRGTLGAVILGAVWWMYFIIPISPWWRYAAVDWLMGHWHTVSNYSHGPLIPLIAAGLLLWKSPAAHRWVAAHSTAAKVIGALLLGRLVWAASISEREIALTTFSIFAAAYVFVAVMERWEFRASRWGWMLIVGSLGLFYFAMVASQGHAATASFVFLVMGLTLFLWGREALRQLFFPIVFLFFMVPLDFLDNQIGLPLRMFVSQVSAGLMNFVGIETIRNGTAIYSAAGGGYQFEVADACSGIRSLMALTTVTAAFAYISQRQQWKRWVLFLSAVPLAVLGNIVRVTLILLVAQVFGQQAGIKVHDHGSGYIIYGVSLSAMVLLSVLLNVDYAGFARKWLRPQRENVSLPLPVAKERFDE
jgi:exosortase